MIRPFFQGEVSSPYPLLCWTPWRPSGPKPRKAVLKRRSPITFLADACKIPAPQAQVSPGVTLGPIPGLCGWASVFERCPPGFWLEGGWASAFERCPPRFWPSLFHFYFAFLGKSVTKSESPACSIRSVSLRQYVSFARGLPNPQDDSQI